MAADFDLQTMIIRLGLALLLGALVGLERDIHGRAAGVRTHSLVALGSALFTIISVLIASAGAKSVITDPGRIAAQIVTGIGFLGAGTIIKEGFTIRGLTTAACFWIVAAIGMAVGYGEYYLGISAAVMAVLALTLLNRFDKLYKKDSYRVLKIKVPLSVDTADIIKMISRKGVSIIFVDFNLNYPDDIKLIKLTLRIFHKGTTDKISRGIIATLEKSTTPLIDISWTHGKMF